MTVAASSTVDASAPGWDSGSGSGVGTGGE
jgi:hypothetical protein